jgi:hypothetical protein
MIAFEMLSAPVPSPLDAKSFADAVRCDRPIDTKALIR